MKTIKSLLFIPFLISIFSLAFIPKEKTVPERNNLIITSSVALEANNIRSWIWNTGVFDQDIRTNNTPGFEWPKGSNKDAIFTAGLTLAGFVNNQLRMAAASYNGEFVPGYCVNGTIQTNSNFKLYRVSRGDNQNTNPDWANWGLMVPYGAPYTDVNNNGTYEPGIDIPGVKNAEQTIFLCMTDADPTSHSTSEGFGGGTAPLGAEVHLTAWCYNNPGYQDMQFLKWVVINKNTAAWDSTLLSIVSDPDLGDAIDDYIGCDTIRKLAYVYNSTDQDGNGTGHTYGAHPPAAGMTFLDCGSPNLIFKSFDHFANPFGTTPICESDANTPTEAYNFMNGLKKDGSPWINPFTLNQVFFNYPGYPENPPASSNWTEFNGSVQNCGGSNGTILSTNPAGDRRYIMNFLRTNRRMSPNDTQVVQISQLIARGTSNVNSVTLLRTLTDNARQLCSNGFVIGINPVSSIVPDKFSLYQNYPNPFNPATKIKFDIAKQSNAKIIIYDAVGREISVVLNEQLKAGTYSIDWNAANYPSGVYFYNLKSGDFSETKKLVLLK